MAKYCKLKIILTEDQRKSLEAVARSGVSAAMEIRRANVLQMTDKARRILK